MEPVPILQRVKMMTAINETEGFTFISKKNVLVNQDNYTKYGRYSVGNYQDNFFKVPFTNNHELKSALNAGLNKINEYFNTINELLLPQFPSFGAWVQDGCLVIDPVSIYDDLFSASKMGEFKNQFAIWDFKTMKEIPL
jgi:hypothetical protein|tara:strand:- start:1647 stop:2063 length:417 start_codon:yes stop_codon:yes gene_type:complete